ncbi:MerR family transcriptional regulator [uncultured Tateyamaria sp.]|uniref:MerR family transcriptional regulator n=1 Tax=uncultured Tateyamaria sp. TaxID=455651 RepID=UPI0026270EBD|nr:MerR family transcriptional regulator [uncultured Tateyamaria sp.]
MSKSADAFRTISEVADWLGVQTHVLRFWESKFTQIKPVKRAGGRRYYRPADMLLLGGIRKLLHDDGLTIKGVQKILREEGMAHVADMSGPLDDETAAQIDGDLVAESDFVEAELAPASAAEDTVTPFPPVTAPAPLTYNLPDPEPEPEEQPPMTAEAPLTPSQEHVTAEPDLAPSLFSEPEPELTPAPDEPAEVQMEVETPAQVAQAADPEPSLVAEPEPAVNPEPEAAAPPFAEEPLAISDAASEPEPEDASPIFAHSPEGQPPAIDVSATPDVEEPAAASTPLPSFLSREFPVPDAPAHDPAPAAQDTAPEPAPAPPAAPRARIVDVPADPDHSTLEAAPSPLSRVSRVTRLTSSQRSALRPLLAQLTALRDQMASARRDP